MKRYLNKFPRLSLSILPTPIHRLNILSKEFSLNIFCKRDDLTGFAFGGNKSRKIDFLIADAINKKTDTIVTIGANQSNFCRIMACAGKIYGFEVHLVLAGRKPKIPTGNLLLDHLFGAIIHHPFIGGTDDWDLLEQESKILTQELTKKGKKVYWLPAGGSTPIGALGYVECFFEIMDYSQQTGTYFDVIIHSSSSGGTQAGLIVGKELALWKGKIIGIGVDKTKEEIKEKVYKLAVETGKLVGLNNIKSDAVIVDNSYKGEKYGARTKECEEAIKLFAQREGILLDYVYSGKAGAGLLDYAKRGLFEAHPLAPSPREGEHKILPLGEDLGLAPNILFIHTGGNVQLF